MEVRNRSPLVSTQISGVPAGVSGKVHVVGQNNMADGQKLGVHWIVKEPGGAVVEDYEDWEFGDTDPGDTHEFTGGSFDINVAGTWRITIGLSMNPDNPVVVDTYDGVLCVAEELRGAIVKKELEYDGSRGNIPVQ